MERRSSQDSSFSEHLSGRPSCLPPTSDYEFRSNSHLKPITAAVVVLGVVGVVMVVFTVVEVVASVVSGGSKRPGPLAGLKSRELAST